MGHPSKFQRVSRVGFVTGTAATSLTEGQPNSAGCFAVSWAGTLYYTFSGALDGTLPRAKFTLRPSLAFSYICSVTARYCSSGRQPNFAAWYKELNYGTFAEGATYKTYSAVRPSLLASAHILVKIYFRFILSGVLRMYYSFWCTSYVRFQYFKLG